MVEVIKDGVCFIVKENAVAEYITMGYKVVGEKKPTAPKKAKKAKK